MSANKERPDDVLDRLSVYDDSIEVADSLRSLDGGYWPAEAAIHIVGLWSFANDLADEVRRLRKLQYVGGRGSSN